MRHDVDSLNGKESSCIHKFGSSGKSILPISQSDPNDSGCSVAEAGSVCGPEELEVPGSPLEFVCEDGATTLLASRWSSPKMILYLRLGALLSVAVARCDWTASAMLKSSASSYCETTLASRPILRWMIQTYTIERALKATY